jgi:LuxR family maltose regulon positive regulatory protein
VQFFLPRPPSHLVARSRVRAALDESLAHGIIMVRGAAGAGKTVALLDWASSTRVEGHVVWVAMAPDAAGRRTFWRRILLALEDSALTPAGTARVGSLSDELADPDLLPHILRTLRRVGSPLTFVVDDYHSVGERVIDEDVAWLAEQAPEVRFILGIRDGAEGAPARLGRAEAALVSGRDLAFTEDETLELAAAFGLDPDAEPVSSLHATTQGWPLATRLLLRGWAEQPGMAPLAGGTTAEIVRRVLESRSGEDRDFLLDTSPAAFLTAEIAELLHAADGASQQRLDRLADEGIGLWQSERSARVFRYHPLLREGLLAEAERLDPGGVRDRRVRLAAWLDAHQQPFEALELEVAAAAWSAMTATLVRHYPTLENEDYYRMARSLRAVPSRALRQQPLLLVARSIADFGNRTTTAETAKSMLELALAHLQGSLGDAATPEGYVMRVARMAMARLTGRHRTALKLARELDQSSALPDGHDPTDPASSIRAYFRPQIGITELYEDDFDAARRNFLTVIEAREAGVHWPRIGIAATNLLALVAAMSGELRTARDWSAASRAYDRVNPEQFGYADFGSRIADAVLALDAFDTSRAGLIVASFDQSVVSNIEHWPYLAYAESLSSLIDGASAGALSRAPRDADLSGRRPPITGHLTALLASVKADLLLAAGQVDRAESVLDGVRGQAAEAVLSRARIQLVRGQPERALRLTQPLFLSSRPRRRAEALLIAAVASDRLAPGSGGDRVREAVAVLRETGLRRPLMMVRRDWLATTLADAIGAAETERLLDGVPDPFGGVRTAQRLSRSERLVLRELYHEGSAVELAHRLSLSAHTVKTHLKNIYRKLGVTSRAEALVVGAELGLAGIDEQAS